MYKLTNERRVIRLRDSASIPMDKDNIDFVEYLKWLEDGGKPEVVEKIVVFPKFFGNAKLDLFTVTEQLTTVKATMSDPEVKLMYDRLLGATFLSYEDPEVEFGLNLLVQKNLLTLSRKQEIVSKMCAS